MLDTICIVQISFTLLKTVTLNIKPWCECNTESIHVAFKHLDMTSAFKKTKQKKNLSYQWPEFNSVHNLLYFLSHSCPHMCTLHKAIRNNYMCNMQKREHHMANFTKVRVSHSKWLKYASSSALSASCMFLFCDVVILNKSLEKYRKYFTHFLYLIYIYIFSPFNKETMNKTTGTFGLQ